MVLFHVPLEFLENHGNSPLLMGKSQLLTDEFQFSCSSSINGPLSTVHS